MRTPHPRKHNYSSDTQNVDVFCRIKPYSGSGTTCVEVVDEKTLKSYGIRSGIPKETLHIFTSVFSPDCSQEIVFQKVALSMVSDLLEGKNGLLFTYGVTGSGKTYSMEGTSKNPGILTRSLDVLFNSVDQYQTKKYVVKPDGFNNFVVQSASDAIIDRHKYEYQNRLRNAKSDIPSANTQRLRESNVLEVPMKALFAVFISLVEVYNNNIYDLLQETSDLPTKTLSSRVLREDIYRNVYVSGCVEVEVKSSDEALNVFAMGQKRRKIGQTALNAESSRSHCVFTIRLVRTGYDAKYNDVIEDKNLLVVSQLCLVDLAGSERTSRTGTYGSRLKEASNINNSLMNLRKCIEALREIQSVAKCSTPGSALRVVPYRDTRLTHLFKNFFEGDGRVVMLVCIHQAAEDYDETMHVLKFAEASQEVTTYRTVLPSTPGQTPYSYGRSKHTPKRGSNHSNSTTDSSSVVVNIDDQVVPIFNELENTEENIRCYLDQLFRDGIDVNRAYDLEKFVSCDSNCRVNQTSGCNGFMHSVEDFDQDSAPEQDRLPKQNLGLKLVDFGSVRSMITHLSSCKRKAYNSIQALFSSVLTDLTNATGRISTDTTLDTVRLDKVRLRQPENLVSVRCKQWESRLAQQKANIQTTLASRKATYQTPATSAKSSQHRLAAFNPRHRRSRSAGGDNGRWLEHQEATAVPLGTILSPTLKRRKSVTRLELKDTLNAENYVLHHQEADSDGNIETKLFKGPIIPTAGGGSAVIFNDVEIIRQTSPISTRRSGLADKSTKRESPRLSIKRRHSASKSPRERHSAESNSTQNSHGSQSSSSSAYCPIGPPVRIVSNFDHHKIESRCQIGLTANGSLGRYPSPVKHNLRKRSRI